MSDKSGIEWTDATWNPVTGCDEVSPGCDRCYAKTFAERFRGTPGHHFERGFDLTLRPERLDQPLRWKKPRRIFVNSMSDLFHGGISDEFIAEVFAVMALARRHTFQLLTKRHGRMRSLLSRPTFPRLVENRMYKRNAYSARLVWPIPGVWLGVSVENQSWANARIPSLLDTPASVRWISAEPLLGPIDLHAKDSRTFEPQWLPATAHGVNAPDQRAGGGSSIGDLYADMYGPNLNWVVVGGESGPGSRPMHPQWARDLRDQCVTAGVPYLYKQSGQFAPVADQPRSGDLWQALDGAVADWKFGDGHIRVGGGDYLWPGGKTTLMRRARSKHDAGRTLDGQTWDQYPERVS